MWMSAAGVKVVSLQSREKPDILVSWLSSALEVITKMVIGTFFEKTRLPTILRQKQGLLIEDRTVKPDMTLPDL
jgi:hypothetical protein